MLIFLQSVNGEQTEKLTFVKHFGQFLGRPHPVVSLSEARHCGPQSKEKSDKNEVINHVDNNTEGNKKRWTLLKRFLHDRSKIIYQRKPMLGKKGDGGTKFNN